LDDAGEPQGNGVPDLVDRFGGRWAVFVADDVSLGSGFEGTAATGGGDLVRNGVVSPAADIGNAYLYGTRDGAGNPVVFMALERLSGADGSVEFEIDQATVRLGHGGYGQGAPWKVNGARAADDLLVRVIFSGGAVAGAELLRWNEGAWDLIAAVTGEGCDAAELICSLSNREPIAAGPWPSYDTSGDPDSIGAGRFVELGVNVGALLGSHPVAQSIRVRTPEDIAFGYVVEGN
ncbi:MAG TPA: hypothetical protein VFD53_09730, partial [Ilumatobacter sp.]|nr:hypothetical protein [Ilumatobacter sp.]